MAVGIAYKSTPVLEPVGGGKDIQYGSSKLYTEASRGFYPGRR